MNTDLNVAETLTVLGTLPPWLTITLILIGVVVLAVVGLLVASRNEYVQSLLTNKTNYNIDMITRESLHDEITAIDTATDWQIKNWLNHYLNHNEYSPQYCNLPREMLLWRIEDKARDWISQNNLIGKLSRDNYNQTKQELTVRLSKMIGQYRYTIKATEDYCNRLDPKWIERYNDKDRLDSIIEKGVEEFLSQVLQAVRQRTQNKLTIYTDYHDKFRTKVVLAMACDKPMEKNRKYLDKL